MSKCNKILQLEFEICLSWQWPERVLQFVVTMPICRFWKWPHQCSERTFHRQPQRGWSGFRHDLNRVDHVENNYLQEVRYDIYYYGNFILTDSVLPWTHSSSHGTPTEVKELPNLFDILTLIKVTAVIIIFRLRIRITYLVYD